MSAFSLANIRQTKEQRLSLPGKAGVMDALLQGAAEPRISGNRLQVAIVLHPHPLQEGTMHNKVVYTLARTFRQFNIPVLRFNFRGVGQSAGVYDHGAGETDDLISIMQQIQQEHLLVDFWLAGFSFGSFVAYQAYTQSCHTYAIKHLCLVGPPTERYAYPLLSFPEDLYFVLLQGMQDEIVNPHANVQWFEQLAARQKHHQHHQRIHMIKCTTGHFFHGKLTQLKQMYGQSIEQTLNIQQQ